MKSSLRAVIIGLVLLTVTPAHADAVERWQPLIAEASIRFGVPESWIKRVMRTESGGQTQIDGQPIRSSKGAMGLMQLMPGTWGEMRRRLDLGDNPDDPRDNIFAGNFYLRLMYDRFGYPGLFAAYQAGPGRYAERLAGRALPPETVSYMTAIGAPLPADPAPKATPRQMLFAIRRKLFPGEQEPKEAPRGDPLFAVRADAR